MDVKRFRLFAGPNGSGKSTLFESLRENGEIHTEIYISADRIEAQIKSTGIFYFNAYRAVSYTHLRAHETVLDLVCRLLLEKKNKHK